jgi:DNA repair protein RecN (Recombination protein N)
MLRTLILKDYALVGSLEVNFSKGLAIITGETGAGKSVIIGAMDLIVGARASSDLIRTGANKAIIEAVFDIANCKSIRAWLKQNEFEESNELIIRREISRTSSARSFINDSPAQLDSLKELGAMLVDLHGQHEHQSLLQAGQQRRILDRFAGIESLTDECADLWLRYTKLEHEINELTSATDENSRQRDLLMFQFTEISAVEPLPGEDDEIGRELSVLENAEEILSLTTSAANDLTEDDDSAYSRVSSAYSAVQKLAEHDQKFQTVRDELLNIRGAIKELATEIRTYHERLELDPQRLDTLRTRLVSLTRLKKKYGPTLDDVITLYELLKEKLSPESTSEQLIADKKNELSLVRKQAANVCKKITEARTEASAKFEKRISKLLKELAMERSKFSVSIRPTQSVDGKPYVMIGQEKIGFGSSGSDIIEFQYSPDASIEVRPFAKIASGGETSRLMLAVKSALAGADAIPVMIFDEIDTGISGRIAQKAGKLMKDLTATSQVIAITHLSQIAAFADTHYVVEKTSRKGVPDISMRQLTDDGHLREIARLIAGETVTTESLEAAKSLKAESADLVG